jgi:uncharacterized protein YeeX (DUF496 family)
MRSMKTKVQDVKKILAIIDELKPYVKRGVSDDALYEILEKYFCKSDKAETKVKPAENVIQ